MSQRKGSVKEGEKGEKCGICEKNVGDRDAGLQCELCERWFHIGCVRISDDIYKVLGKMTNLHWFCEPCNNGARRLFVNLGKLNERMSQVEVDLKMSKAEYAKLNERMEKMEKLHERVETENLNLRVQKIENLVQYQEEDIEKVRENIERFDRDLGDANDEFEGVNKKIEESKQKLDDILTANAEQEDIEARRNNIILYRVTESTQVRAEARQKEDVDFCEKFLIALQVGVDPDDIKKVLRLGKRSSDGMSPRPVLIQLGSRHIKNLITESLYKIKSLEAKFQNIIVSHDMTKKQREECKALVEEAKRKSESGDWIYKVRGPPGNWKLIQTKKRN